MEQLTLFATQYKYIMDTSSILSQKPGEPHTRLVYKSQWEDVYKRQFLMLIHISPLRCMLPVRVLLRPF